MAERTTVSTTHDVSATLSDLQQHDETKNDVIVRLLENAGVEIVDADEKPQFPANGD